MLVARQPLSLLSLGVLLFLIPCSSAPRDNPLARATADFPSARIDFSLAPPSPASPGDRPLVVDRPHARSPRAPAARPHRVVEPGRPKGAVARQPPPAKPAPRPGLFTVARTGGLWYRKGYLGAVPVHLILADLNDRRVRLGVLIAQGGIGSRESFAGMIHRAQPAAAITGTFFGVHSGLPTGDLVVHGHAIYQGFVGTAIAFTTGNLVSFIRTGYKEKTAWRFFDGVMRAGPMLVRAGTIVLGPRHEGFVSLSPAAQRPRTAVGITPGGKLLLLAVKEPISLWRLAKLMRALGAYHAVAMDGGTSTGLYFAGRMVAQPARALTNALVIYSDQPRAEEANRTPSSPPHLAPLAPSESDPALDLRVETVSDRPAPRAPQTAEATSPLSAQPTRPGGAVDSRVSPAAAAAPPPASVAAGPPHGSPSRGAATAGAPGTVPLGKPMTPAPETARVTAPAPG